MSDSHANAANAADVQLLGVTKRFGSHTAVDDVSVTVPAGSCYGFIGPNGSGKTTTLRMIMRIFHPDDGIVRVLGADHAQRPDDRVGYLPEERSLYKGMKVREVLAFMNRMKGYAPGKGEIDAALERIGLGGWADKKVEQLSKGMTQKVQFLATTMPKPKLVLLDEVFSGLDPVNQVVIRDAIFALREAGTTVIFSTHDMSTAERMCDQIFMIYKGKKVLDGTLDTIKHQYGEDVLRVDVDGVDHDQLSGLPGVGTVTEQGNLRELHLAEDADRAEILRRLTTLGDVRHFELARPSLQDIFVRIASPAAEDLAPPVPTTDAA
ncbi:MAG: ATP-binding cassette domain-containing protein [Planctomycetota bacterium]